MSFRVYPRVFRSGQRQTLYYVPKGEAQRVEIRIYGMEKYTLPRTEALRIDEEWRHPLVPMTRGEDGIYTIGFTPKTEGRYTFRILENGEHGAYGSLYAADDDLLSLTPYKGDTHLHSCRSDGVGTPFEVACAYRREGFDFICLTDHHRYAPSLEAHEAVSALTDAFTVLPGEEVHNKDMGYIHIVNLGGSGSVNTVMEEEGDYVAEETARILRENEIPEGLDPRTVALRILIAEEIRRRGGLAVLAHPYWNTGGEYSMESAEAAYHLRRGTFDAFELLASNDRDGNGDNLQIALYYELREEGVRTPILGASDRHNPEVPHSLFNRHFSVVFAKDLASVPDAIRAGMSVAVNRRTDSDYTVYGAYRLVKYTRFLLDNLTPHLQPLFAAHADAMAAADRAALRETEAAILAVKGIFFAR